MSTWRSLLGKLKQPGDDPPATAVLSQHNLSSASQSKKTFPAGLKVLYEPESAIVDLVFVHSITSDREETWKAKRAVSPWPQALLPAKLPYARMLTFGYEPNVADWRSILSRNRISNYAKNLLSALAMHRGNDNTTNRPIVFVAHSLGGLVCEDALLVSRNSTDEYLQNILTYTKGILFLGTPHGESGLARWAELLAKSIGLMRQTNPQVLEVLKTESEVLVQFQTDFHAMMRALAKDEGQLIAITCFYEELPLPGIGEVVPMSSAILPACISIGIHSHHLDMTKFGMEDDPGLISVAGELQRWVKELQLQQGTAIPLIPPILAEQLGVKVLFEPGTEDSIVDIVAVHGIGANPDYTWTTSGVNWLEDPVMLPQALPRARIMRFGYNSQWFGENAIKQRLSTVAEALLRALRAERKECHERPIVFIGHCFGGLALVTAKTLEHQWPDMFRLTTGVVFLGTPHRGTGSITSKGLLYAAIASDPSVRTDDNVLKALENGNDVLMDTLNDFISLCNAPVVAMSLCCFFEQQVTRVGKIIGKDFLEEFVVDETSGCIDGHPKHGLPLNHFRLNKFSSSNDGNYRAVKDEIQRLVDEAPQKLAVRCQAIRSRTAKAHFLVPFTRDPQFVGREDIIASINHKFRSEQRIALAGIGGVGKSQIAIEYCYRYKHAHPNNSIFWIHAGSVERFDQAYKETARKLTLPGWDDPKVNILRLVFEWLSDDVHGPRLLILDNADDMDVFWANTLSAGDERTTPLASYLPQTQNCSTLITTRDMRVGTRLASENDLIDILPMTDSEAEILLSSRLVREDSDSNDVSSKKLVHILGYLPLAITQAAAFISENSSTIDEYLKVFHANDSEMQDLLSESLPDKRRNLQDRDCANSVIRTWKVSFDQIRKQELRAAEVLSLMAVLDGQGIPKILLDKDGGKGIQFIKAIGTLKAFSFISIQAGRATFAIHRLVQVATRTWLDLHGEMAKWQEMALHVLTDSFPLDSNEVEIWVTCEALLPHVQVVLQYNYVSDESLLGQAELLHRVSSYNFRKGYWHAAHQKALKAFQIREEILGSKNPLTLKSMVSVARFLYAQSRFKAADDILQQHLNLSKSVLGLEHPETLMSMSLAGSILFHYKGQFVAGEELYRRTYELRKKVLGLEHPDTLISMGSLGLMLRRQGKLAAAVDMHENALMLQQKVLGPHHPDTTISLDYLSQALTAQGDCKTAEELCRRALQSQEERLGPEHPQTFQIMGSLAHVLSRQPRYEDSEEMYRNVLAIRKRVLGGDHRDTLMNLYLLGGVLESQGKYKEAEAMYEKSLISMETKMGSEHPDTMNCFRFLAGVLRKQDKPEAEAMTRKLLELEEKHLGDSHEYTMLTIQGLASSLERRSDYSGAEKMFQRLLELREQVFGPDSNEVIRVMRQLMFNLGRQGKVEEALGMCKSLLRLQLRKLGEEHSDTIMTINVLVSYLGVLGRQEESKDQKKRSLKLQEKVLDDDHPNSITKLSRLAQSLENEKKYEEAIVTYQGALRLQSIALGSDHSLTVSTICDLQRILRYTDSEVELLRNRNSRISWLNAPERLVEHSSRFPNECNQHSRLVQKYR